MPFNLADLREKRNKSFADAADVIKSTTGEVTPEIRSKYDGFIAEVDQADADIARLERVEREESEQRSRQTNRPQPGSPETRDAEIRTSFTNYLRTGVVEKRDLTVGTQGVMIPQLFSKTMIQAQKSYGEVYDLVTVMKTENGDPIKMVTSNDTANGLVSVSVGTDVGEVDPPTANLMLNVSPYSTGMVRVDKGLVTDAGFDIEGWLNNIFLKRWFRGASGLIVSGDNVSVQSLVTAYSTGALISATANKLGYADIVAMIAALDPAYQANAVFAASNATLGSILNIVDSNGRPLFLPGFGAADGKFIGTLLGYPVKLVTQLPGVATGNVPLLFGDFAAAYTFRQQGDGLQISRLDERYLPAYEIGFIGFARVGGVATSAGVSPVLALQIK